MTILTMPSLEGTVSEFRWQLVSNTQTFKSPLTGFTKRAELAGSAWASVITFKSREPESHREWMVFLSKLRGAAGVCYFPISWAFPRTGTGGGTPLVKTASQTGTTLLIDGATPNVTGWLKAGDYFHFDTSVGREMKILTQDANSDASGNVTLVFEPPIRTSPPENGAIEISNPSVKMRLIDDNQSQWSIRSPVWGDATFQFVEVIP